MDSYDLHTHKAESSSFKRQKLSESDYVQGVLERNRSIIAQTITLVESNHPKHLEVAQKVLKELIPYAGNSIRIGLTGVPGSGKSTLIESFGMMLCNTDSRVAVLSVDPSSSITGGSILGDKTRMEMLSHHKNAFVRPTPTSGALGGVGRRSRESIFVLEAAGYDVIIVETVGVGQSEITVRSIVDFFLVIMLTGAGDELQRIKKGVMEIADAIFINKADGRNKQAAINLKEEYNRLLHYLQPSTEGWCTKAYTVSALNGEGISEIWDIISKYQEITKLSGKFKERRRKQNLFWVEDMIEERLKFNFYENPTIKDKLPEMQELLFKGKISPILAVKQLFTLYDEKE